MSAISNFLFGSPAQTKQLPTMDKNQLQFLNQLMQMLGSGGGLGQGFGESTDYLRQLMDPSSEAVSRFTDPYKTEFEQQTVPMLAERFAGMGGGMGGGLSSSGFGQSLSAAGSNLQQQLAALRAGLGQQAAGQLMQQYGNMAQLGLGAKPFGYVHEPGSTGAVGQAISGWASGGFPGASNIFDMLKGLWSNPQQGGITRNPYGG